MKWYFQKNFQDKIMAYRKYGFYKCPKYGNKWTSAFTWLIPKKGLLRQKFKNGCKNLKANRTVSQRTTSLRKCLFQIQQMEDFKWPCLLLGCWYGACWPFASIKLRCKGLVSAVSLSRRLMCGLWVLLAQILSFNFER